MDVVHADIGGEPAAARRRCSRAAVQRPLGRFQVPRFSIAFSNCLDIEQPDPIEAASSVIGNARAETGRPTKPYHAAARIAMARLVAIVVNQGTALAIRPTGSDAE